MSFPQSREFIDEPHRPPAPACVRAAALFLTLLALIIACGTEDALLAAPSARQETAAGWSAFERQEWSEAEAAFRRAIAADPALAEAYQGLGEALLRQGREREAARVIGDGLQYLGDDPAALRPLAEILSRNDATRADSLPIYRAILDETPDDARLRLEFARNLAWSGHHREALEHCRRLQEKGTKSSIRSEAALLEAQILSWSGRTREAEEKYEAILAAGPSAEAHTGLGEIDRWEGRYAEAGAHYHEALAIDPDNADALQGLHDNDRDAAPALTFRAGLFDDSSDFRRETYTLFADFFQARRLSLRAGAARIRYEDVTGRQIYRTAIPLQGRFWAGRSVSLRGGVALNEYTEDAPDTTSWFLHGDLSPGRDRVRVRVGIHHYDVIDDSDPLGEYFYNQAETIDVARQEITIDELRAGMLVRLTDRLSLNSDIAAGDLSDDNERASAYSRLSYRLPGDPRVDLFGAFFWQNV
ncbi:MAG TPA: tetratricopeptide repeat protein, partial [Candidatus Polarisedimenticolia bacterium]|nr:tetratricopeptide repeat protein [Candidatus Polarisedimenticolia bacterium]